LGHDVRIREVVWRAESKFRLSAQFWATSFATTCIFKFKSEFWNRSALNAVQGLCFLKRQIGMIALEGAAFSRRASSSFSHSNLHPDQPRKHMPNCANIALLTLCV